MKRFSIAPAIYNDKEGLIIFYPDVCSLQVYNNNIYSTSALLERLVSYHPSILVLPHIPATNSSLVQYYFGFFYCI